MRIKYNILWVENEKDWLDPSLEYVKEVVEEYGFELSYKHVSSELEISQLLEEPEPLKEFDLILVDLQLDRGDRGSKIIENIRDHKIFTDVIFYSQDVQGIRQAVTDHFLDGVYCASRNRNDFEEKFEKVFYTTIKKIQDISSVRGLVISEASELDHRIHNLVVGFFKSTSKEKENIRKYIFKDIIGNLEVKGKKKLDYLSALSNDELIEHNFFDSYKKMRILGKIIEAINNKKIITKEVFINEYNSEIIQVRNELAHCIENLQDGKKVLITRDKAKIFDDNGCKDLRRNIRKHSSYLDSIQALI